MDPQLVISLSYALGVFPVKQWRLPSSKGWPFDPVKSIPTDKAIWIPAFI